MTTRRWALYGPNSRDWLTYGGRILWHDSKPELEFMVPAGAIVREMPPTIPEAQCLHISQHPGFSGLTWPLTREQFK